MTCPVCKNKAVSSSDTKCLNCSTSLLGMKLYYDMEDQFLDLKKEKIRLEGNLVQQKNQYEAILKKNRKRHNRRWLFLSLLVPLGLYLLIDNNEPQLGFMDNTIQQDSIRLLQHTLMAKESELIELNRQLSAIKTTKVRKELKYVVKKGDTLNELAKLFYNDSTAWYQVALDNKIYDIRGLPIGDTIVLKYRERGL